MRVFVAVDVDEAVRKSLGRLAEELQSELGFSRSDARWVNTDNIHITLKFLGEIKDNQLDGVFAAIGRAVSGQRGFDIEIGSVGCFSPRNPRVLWTAVTEGTEQLGTLQKRIDEQLGLEGFEREKREFAAHLTLCRIKKPGLGKKVNSIIPGYSNKKIGSVAVDSVVVYQSDLSGSRPIYTALARYELL